MLWGAAHRALGARCGYHHQAHLRPPGRGEERLQPDQTRAAEPGLPQPLDGLGAFGYFIGTLRVCLDVEVESGDHAAAQHGHAALWRIIDELPAAQRPACIRGDLAYGEEKLMRQCEQRGQRYLFKLRQSPRVKDLVKLVEKRGTWVDAGQGFECLESPLRLNAWTCERRVIVLRRPIRRAPGQGGMPLLESQNVAVETRATHEYMVLITSLDLPILGIAQLYRDRADVENCFDEPFDKLRASNLPRRLKNQWGWGGFTTRDLARSQTMARLVALIYNWWSLFVGLIEPEKHAEAIHFDKLRAFGTSRPELLHGVGRITQSGRQTTVTVTSTHEKAARTQARQSWVGRFLSRLREAAEQLTRADIWRLILSRVFVRFLRGEIIGGAPSCLSPSPA